MKDSNPATSTTLGASSELVFPVFWTSSLITDAKSSCDRDGGALLFVVIDEKPRKEDEMPADLLSFGMRNAALILQHNINARIMDAPIDDARDCTRILFARRLLRSFIVLLGTYHRIQYSCSLCIFPAPLLWFSFCTEHRTKRRKPEIP